MAAGILLGLFAFGVGVRVVRHAPTRLPSEGELEIGTWPAYDPNDGRYGQFDHAARMQAIGQLAGGVAHDFNNVLTGILGQCDLMLMRHAPGDIDYDDIQQIKNNANRAAALTRQLLAFSRQQTLRPQILQYLRHLTACALDVLVKLAAFLYRRNSSVSSGK